MRNLYSLLAVLLCAVSTPLFAQLSGTKTIPGDYASISAAVADLNTVGVGAGGVTFNVSAGYTESTTSAIQVTTLTGSGATPIIFQKSGPGANPKITRTDGGSNTTSTLGGQGDAVIVIDGGDYITFDGIDVATSASGIEYGYYLRKASATDACKNIVIQNAAITMTKGTSAYVTGIYLSNNIPTSLVSSATGVTVTSTGGRTENIEIKGNTISNAFAGIILRGYAASSPYTLYDQNITVGASGAGNTIQNIAGNTASTSYGVYAIYQNALNVSYNTIDNAGGGGAGATSIYYGIFSSTGTTSSFTATNNNVISTSASASSGTYGIYNSFTGNLVMDNNTVSLANSAASSGTYAFLYNSSATAATTISISNNSFAASTFNTTGTTYLIYNSNTYAAIATIANNTTTGTINRTGATGTFYCYYNLSSPTGTDNIYGNNFSNISNGNTSTATLHGIYLNTTSSHTQNIYNNVISNMSTGSGTSYGIYALAANTRSVYNNSVYDFTGTGSLIGINTGSGSTSGAVYNNKVYGLSSTSTGTATVTGLQIAGGTTVPVYNNIIGLLSAANSTSSNAITGIGVTGGTTVNLYYNTVNLDATTTSATTFGSSALYISTTTPVVTAKNNIFVNTSQAGPTGGITVAFRYTAAPGPSYSSNSGNNLFYTGTVGNPGTFIYGEGTTTTANTQLSIDDYKTYIQVGYATREANSVTENPPFANTTTGSSANYLHITSGATTLVESGGANVGGITTDFDNDIRQGNSGYSGTGSKPDIGADEFEGVTPAPSLSNLLITPTGNACTATSRNVTVTATPVAPATISTVVIDYTVDGATGGSVAMTNSGGNNWTGTIPALGNAVIAWTVTATDNNAQTVTAAGTTYQDNPLFGATATATASASPICAGSNTVLTGTFGKTGNISVGTGSGTSGTTSGNTPFYGGYGGVKTQYLIRASEMTAAGVGPGNINSLAMQLTTAGSTLNGFAISFDSTNLTALSTNIEDVTNLVYSGTFVPSVGVNTFPFIVPFNWNGTSNIIISICWSNNNTSNTASQVKNNTTTFVAGNARYVDSRTAAEVCGYTGSATPAGWNGAATTVSTRPMFTFDGVINVPMVSYNWSDGSGSVGTTNPLTVNPTTTTNYSITGTDANGCSISSAPVTVNVTALPAAPTAGAPSSQCGNGVPSVSVTSNTGQPTPTFNWYAASSGGAALQSGTSNTYTSSISSSTTFYVSEQVGSCESPRVAVTANVTQPDAVTAKINGSATPGNSCPGTAINLFAEQSGTNNPYVFTWTASPVAGSGIPTTETGAAATVTPTDPGTYTYTVSATDGVCNTTSAVTIVIETNPVINTPVASPAITCFGQSTTLTATTNIVGAGSATVGTDNAATKINTNGVPYRTGVGVGSDARNQYLVLASELTAAGIFAGDITSLTFTVTTASPTGSMSNLTFKMAPTAATALTSTFLAPTFTTVLVLPTYSPVTGDNTHTFTTPFNWNGTDNILIEVCGTNSVSGSGCTMATYASPTPSTVGAGSSGACSAVSGTLIGSSARPVMKFGAQVGTTGAGSYTWLWTPGNLSGNSVTATPASTGINTYTVKASSAAGCFSTATVDVDVQPVTATATSSVATPVCEGTTVTVDVTPGGGAPFTYVWKNAANTTVGTTKSVDVIPASPGDTYTVTVTDACGNSVNSSIAVVVNANPTSAIVEAGPITICEPATQQLTASTNAASPSYQWMNNAVNIGGATGSALNISAVGTGNYSLKVTDGTTSCSSVSAAVTVTVNQQPAAMTISPASAAICANSIQQLDVTGGQITSSVLSGTGASTSAATSTGSSLGPNPLQMYYGGTKQQWIYTASELTSLGFVSGTTINAIKINLVTANTTYTLNNLVVKMKNSTTSSFSSTSAWESTGMNVVRAAADFSTVVGLNTIALTTPFSWDGTSNLIIEINYSNNNGGSSTSPNTAKYSPTSFVSTIFYRADNTAAATIDAYAMTANYTYSARTDVTFDISTATAITWSPITDLYTDAAATTAYTGAGSVNTVYAKPTATRTYTATSTSAANCTNTASVVVTLNPPTEISTQPVSPAAACLNGVSPGVSVSATGTGTLTYQWYSNTVNSNTGGTLIPGATNASYSAPVSSVGTTYYYVEVTGDCGAVTSNTASVVVNDATSISAQPISPSEVCVNGLAPVLNVGASGSGTITYQWYSNTTNSTVGGSLIAGASNSSYTVPVNVPGTVYYYVTATGDCGPVTSNTATVTVGATPTASTSLAGTSGGASVCANYDVAASNFYMNNCDL
ncbi:MAG TPA: hypothetical protein VF145_03265, partial [Chitinophagaceae bacterium]